MNPERGEHEYADVEFADPVLNKDPIDTPKHVRPAWGDIKPRGPADGSDE